MYGNATVGTSFLDPAKFQQLLLYSPATRRVKTMSSTDQQDPNRADAVGMDAMIPSRNPVPRSFPMQQKIIEEREFLVFSPNADGSLYLTSDTFEYRNVRMERRPLYVVELMELDKHFVYSKRHYYIDKETFTLYYRTAWDQKADPIMRLNIIISSLKSLDG